ncbi:MAG: sulfite exporter TauE/SafE family protein [Thermodesulfobacteriota bacterium]
MTLLTEYWLMLPCGILISAIAMFFGLGGGVLWMPLLLTATDLEPREAVACALVIQFFGQASASVANSRAGLIDWSLVKMMMVVGIPTVALGGLISLLLRPLWIELFLGLTIFFIAYVFLRGDDFFVEGSEIPDRTAAARGRSITAVGGVLTGFVGIGVGDWLVPFFNKQCKLVMVRSVATSIALMMVLSLTALTVYRVQGVRLYWSIAIPSIIGVLVGAQLGSRMLHRVSETRFKEIFVLMLIFIASHVTFNAL